MDRRSADQGIAAYEGLVIKTSQMFADWVGLELDDMRQELRLKILKAQRRYSSSKSGMTEQAFVYACVANLVKDLKRNAARRSARLHIAYIEDFGPDGQGDALDRLTSHDEVYGAVDDGFVMPTGVSGRQEEIIYLLVIGYAQTQVAEQLGIEREEVVKQMRLLRKRFADWRPTTVPAIRLEPVAA